MHVPEAFLRCLQHMDPLLSVRWGPFVEQWVVERKAIFSDKEVFWLKRRTERLDRKFNAGNATEAEKTTRIGCLEDLASSENGCRVVLFAKTLNDHIYNQLCLSDITKYGGYSRYCDELERAEDAREKDTERQLSNERVARWKEAAGIIRFLDDKRSTMLDHGCRDVAQMLGTKDYMPKTLPKHLLDANGRVAKTL
jgi:hypothetical protein